MKNHETLELTPKQEQATQTLYQSSRRANGKALMSLTQARKLVSHDAFGFSRNALPVGERHNDR